MSIKAGVEDRSRNLTTAFVSATGTDTTREWVNYSLAGRPQERKERTMSNISLGLEETMHDLQIGRPAKEDQS
ncbi:MAG: hypothetical protein IID37_01210 [Planctomycetes bacterium]|nr:hypothetical protein [Planctomycetota bacterium]